ncbi:hypothetical protein JXR01_02530 [Candidatus Kaiserbacteria bacterium]|nr:MAG: hypothetical protein JXR01_02530 [Candidatus Kaiserbacteria bacterium]
MESLLRTHKMNLTLSFIALLVFGYFFVGVSFTNAQSACPQSSFGVYINHEVCQPAGPPPKGRDGLFICWATGITGGAVNGVCTAGCCQVSTYTPAPTGIFGGSLGGGFIEGVAQGIVVQTAVGFINNLISGGIGTDSYSGSGGTQYDYIDDVSTFLDVTDDYGANNNDNGFNLDFGDDNSDDSSNTDSIFTILDRENPTTNTTGGASPATNNTRNTQTGDSVTTSYQSLDGGSSNSSGGNTEFGQELLDNLDDPAYTSGLSLAELERAAEEARRREALLNEQNAGTGDIGDYRSSNVSQSGTDADLLAEGYYDSLGTEEERLAWWRRILMLIADTLGL